VSFPLFFIPPFTRISSSFSSSDLTLRDEYILAYADYLQSDPHLWRLTVAYMYSCGEIGQGRGDEILCRVPLRLYEQKAKSLEGNPEDGLNGTLKQVNQTCFEYQRETVRRAVCKVPAFLGLLVT